MKKYYSILILISFLTLSCATNYSIKSELNQGNQYNTENNSCLIDENHNELSRSPSGKNSCSSFFLNNSDDTVSKKSTSLPHFNVPKSKIADANDHKRICWWSKWKK